MQNLRNLINNDFVYYALIIIGIIVGINVISKFIDNLFMLIRNFGLILFYLKLFLKKLVIILFKSIFFPITFYCWLKEYLQYNLYFINSSEDKSI